MIVIVCVDECGGMLFNRRRQSQDAVLRKRILTLCEGHRLLMNAYSAKQFDAFAPIDVSEDFLAEAGKTDYCFVENKTLAPYESHIEKVIRFNWNRHYPADQHFDLKLSPENWALTYTYEFAGSSHERITEEHFHRITGGDGA